ncbi:MAG TPA: hypothetical protein VH682_23495 [Gemmataceae bacterium]|jgi:hypothetical protein
MPQATEQQPEPSDVKPLIFYDFNLRFSGSLPDEGTFRVWVEGETPGGTMKPENAVERPFRPESFWDEPEYQRGGILGDLERRDLEEQVGRLPGLVSARRKGLAGPRAWPAPHRPTSHDPADRLTAGGVAEIDGAQPRQELVVSGVIRGMAAHACPRRTD